MKSLKNLKWLTILLVALLSANCSSDDSNDDDGGGNVFANYSITIDGVEHNGSSPSSDTGTSVYDTDEFGSFITVYVPNIPSGDESFSLSLLIRLDENDNPLPLSETTSQGEGSGIVVAYNAGQPNQRGYSNTTEGSISIEGLALSPMPVGEWAKLNVNLNAVLKDYFSETTIDVSGTVEVVGNYGDN